MNTHPKTGIPYGVITLNSISPDWAAELWTTGRNLSEEAALEEARLEIEALLKEEGADEDDIEYEVERRLERIEFNIEEPVIEGCSEDVHYMIGWLGGAPMLWVFESPFTGTYSPCSPCIPGAGDLDSPNEEGIECYDVPKEWRDDASYL